MSGAPLGHSWNPETRILLLSQQEESGLGRHKRGHSQSWWGKRVKPVELQTQRLRGFLSSRWKGIRVFFYLFIWARSSTEPDLKCWQISFEKNRASVCNSNCLTTVYPPTTPQCQRQALSLKLQSSDPVFFFFFPLASEEGSRCKITGLQESERFELELRLLSSCGMKGCRRLGALC